MNESRPAASPEAPATPVATDDGTLLDEILAEKQRVQDLIRDTGTGRTPDQASSTEAAIIELLRQVRNGKIVVTGDLQREIVKQIEALDKEIEDQVNTIIHDPKFQQLERV